MRIPTALALWAAMNATCWGEVVFPRGERAHVLAAPKTDLEERLLDRLDGYLTKVLGKPSVVVDAPGELSASAPAIVLVNDGVPSPIPVGDPGESAESFTLTTGQMAEHGVVVASGRTDRGLKRAIQRLVVLSRQEPSALVIPDLKLTESPWIPCREWTICPWSPRLVRGVFSNPQADKRLDIWLYSDRQLADYVEMFDWFGFSGCQLIETSYNYAVLGSIEANKEWQKTIARQLRKNGQEVSLWVWAAQFSGFGWYDPEGYYTSERGKSAFDDPQTRRVFEKYYDVYAELAPYIDRVFGHFYDPGMLVNQEDVFQYMRLLEAKFKAKNPKVQMGIDYWAAGQDYQKALVDNGFQNYLLLLLTLPESYPPGRREQLHEEARQKGLKLGIWGWYTTEYETDQLASMYVNAQVIRSVYQQVRKAIEIHPVQYWSEMEAHHLNNIHSMYVASRLLWNPELDVHDALRELATGIWGPVNGNTILKALELIQDVRSGPTWDTYWWTRAGHRVGTDDPMEDLRRAEAALTALAGMRTDSGFVSKFPLPFPPETFIDLMLPHLRQIKLFAEFRIEVAEIRRAAEAGASQEQLQEMLDKAWQPIPEYNTWIGTFGNKEIREQDKIGRQLAQDLNLTIKDPAWFRYLEADRLYQLLVSRQQNRSSKYQFTIPGIGEFFWSEAKMRDRLQKLMDDGVVKTVGDGKHELDR